MNAELLKRARAAVPECGPQTMDPPLPTGPRHQEACAPTWPCGRHAAIAALMEEEYERGQKDGMDSMEQVLRVHDD